MGYMGDKLGASERYGVRIVGYNKSYDSPQDPIQTLDSHPTPFLLRNSNLACSTPQFLPTYVINSINQKTGVVYHSLMQATPSNSCRLAV